MIYTLENEHLLVKISNIGATLISFIEKETGTDIVLGYDDENDYFLYSDAHLGATVGRNANRIGKGHFKINGIDHQTTINNGPNSLHSGFTDLSFRAYELKELSKDALTLSIKDSDMSGGFPGDLKLEVTYKLEGNDLLFSFKGLCDKDSILNVTNHSYFNLNGGKGNIFDQELKLYTDKVSLNDDDGMATDKLIDVKATAFDFTDFRNLGEAIREGHDNFSNGGIDHNYDFGALGDKKVAVLRNDELELSLSSDLPCVHVYTSNFLDKRKGKQGNTYDKYWGICLECDFYPNGINYEGIIKPLIKANEEVRHYIRYTIRKQ